MTGKKLPIGIEFFDEIRFQDFYYVDKTGLIIDLFNSWGKVNLFTRPRRFGKTLNMTMLKSFFEIGGDKSIFDGLAVSNEKELCEKHMGRYPVIFLTLKGVDGLSFDAAYNRLRELIRNEAQRLSVLRTSPLLDDTEKNSYMRIINEQDTPTDIAGSLKMLSTLLEKHYGRKVVMLIDEYDVPLDKAYAHGFYPQMIDMIRAMLSAALKTNDSLFMAVLTGCMRVSRESIFTGLNNLMVHSISDVSFDEYFGFTDAEVKQMLAYYGLENHYDEIRQWYDGYLFGGQNIYCPWDVIYYCYDLRANPAAQPKAYWLNSSGNDIVRRLIDRSQTTTTKIELEDLIAGHTIVKPLNEQMTHNEIDLSVNNVWSLLYMTGYLTVVKQPTDGQYELRIPNRELGQIYKSQVLEWFSKKAEAESDRLSELFTAFEAGDADAITRILNRQLMTTVSYHDAKESFYHGFLLALLSTCARWGVSSNAEAGAGRADIVVEREDGEFGFIIELKFTRDRRQLDSACAAAMAQIDDRKYTYALRRFGMEHILAYAIAFCGKRCKVLVRPVQIEYSADDDTWD